MFADLDATFVQCGQKLKIKTKAPDPILAELKT